MYGQIHCVIRELVLTKYGQQIWETILSQSDLDEHDSFLVFTRYDDVITFNLIQTVSDTLSVPVETVLEIFGEFFFDYCLRHGYDKMLRTLGSDMKSFIQNLDSLHSLLALSYTGISAPSFRCEDSGPGELILHYYSIRPGLYPIVKGVLRSVARVLFDQSVDMTILEQNTEDIGSNQTQEHTAFRVILRAEGGCSDRSSPEGGNSQASCHSGFQHDQVLLKATEFCSAFPYHIIFDRELRIRQCGDLVQKHSPVPITDGTLLTSAFSVVHPKMVVSIDNIRKFINAVFLLAVADEDHGSKKTFLLKGQMLWLPLTHHMIFIGSPRLTSLNELMEMKVFLADIPLYDVTRELVLLNQQRIAEIDIAKRLDETTSELKKTSRALKQEKLRTETLLHKMLPQKVATALTNGQKVEAEKFDQVTVLFSDIVTFTNIASACSPMDVVDMLNDLYQRFDERTSRHNVYKVETIGDAYMIVSGVPEPTPVHAQPVADFAMDMVEEAGQVRSPATGLPLQIRIGIHTGPVVAGVVGVKMPRYCLFGDTVNTASRMESHGVPGRIHLSPWVFQALRVWGYSFKYRGQMEVKGKGIMDTYFLCGHRNRRLEEPQDEFRQLQTFQDGDEDGETSHWMDSSRDSVDSNRNMVVTHKCSPSKVIMPSGSVPANCRDEIRYRHIDHSSNGIPNLTTNQTKEIPSQDNSSSERGNFNKDNFKNRQGNASSYTVKHALEKQTRLISTTTQASLQETSCPNGSRLADSLVSIKSELDSRINGDVPISSCSESQNSHHSFSSHLHTSPGPIKTGITCTDSSGPIKRSDGNDSITINSFMDVHNKKLHGTAKKHANANLPLNLCSMSKHEAAVRPSSNNQIYPSSGTVDEVLSSYGCTSKNKRDRKSRSQLCTMA